MQVIVAAYDSIDCSGSVAVVLTFNSFNATFVCNETDCGPLIMINLYDR